MTHEFYASLAKSEAVAEESWWEDVYRKEFHFFESMERIVGDCPQQRQGVDRIIHLKDGKQVYIDEKVRHTDYDDILIEVRSSAEQNTKGWACKPLHCDYIAYVFLPSKRCYFLPFQQLQRALRKNWYAWNTTCKKVEAQNRGYTTESLAVPIPELQRAITDASVIHWDA